MEIMIKHKRNCFSFQTKISLFRGLYSCNQCKITTGFRGNLQWNTGFLRINQNSCICGTV